MDIAEKTLRLKADFDDVFEAGKKAEYDKMWDVLQPEGITFYNRKFMGSSFNFDNFYPKRDIRPVGDATQIFYAWENGNCKGDFKARLEECDVVLDTSKATNLGGAFNYSHMDHLPTIDCTGLTVECSGLFANSWGDMKTIEKIILKDTVKCINWFNNATGLENVIFEGTIGQKGFDIHWSTKLTHDSLMSLLNALADKSGTGTTFTITLGTENLAKLTDAEKAIATQKGWSLA